MKAEMIRRTKTLRKKFRQAIHERNTRSNEIIDKRTWLDELLKANLLHLRDNIERLRKGLAKCRDYIFNFLKIPQFHPTTMRAREESEN